jgi:hypothetical protein
MSPLRRWLSTAWPPSPPCTYASLLDFEVGPKFRRELSQACLVRPWPGRPTSRPRLLLKPLPLRGVFADEGGGFRGETENHVLGNHARVGDHANEMPRLESNRNA